MGASANQLRKRYEEKPDDALLEIVLGSPGDYTAQARSVATEILESRGVSVDEERERLQARQQRERSVRDAERERAEQVRQELVSAIAEAGRESGQCLLDAAHPAETEITLSVRADAPPSTVRFVGDTQIRSFTTLPVPVPLCRACASKNDPDWIMSKLPGLWALVVFFAGLLLPMVLAFAGVLNWIDEAGGGPIGGIAVFVAPPAITFGLFGIDALIGHVRMRRLFQAHPMSDELRKNRFSPTKSRGTPAIDLYAQQLETGSTALKEHAEHELIRIGDSRVVDRARELLDNKHTCQAALRILGALHARDALDDIRTIARTHKSSDTRDLAHAVLDSMGEPLAREDGDDDTAGLPRARVVKTD